MTFPVFDLPAQPDWQSSFFVRHPLFTAERCDEAIADARDFFARGPEEKRRLAIEHSLHFRGYGEMRNERDFREQIHFGREEPACGNVPAYNQLRGPNQWPNDGTWRARVLRLMLDLETVGRELLATAGLPMPEECDPYVLLKIIQYDAQPSAENRRGVAAHVDFSYLTLLLQDDLGGLEVRTSDGTWCAVPPVAGCLFVNAGEILECISGGRIAATPHRVTNRSGSQPRISLPFFYNPGLDSVIRPQSGAVAREEKEHVHRVFDELPTQPFVFGEAEWRRKGQGVWCGRCVAGAHGSL